MSATLSQMYGQRALLAYTIETTARTMDAAPAAVDANTLAQRQSLIMYEEMQAQILALSREHAAVWHRPRASHLLDWCSICGDAERERLPGHNACVVCEARVTQPDTHCVLHGATDCRLCAKAGTESHPTLKDD